MFTINETTLNSSSVYRRGVPIVNETAFRGNRKEEKLNKPAETLSVYTKIELYISKVSCHLLHS